MKVFRLAEERADSTRADDLGGHAVRRVTRESLYTGLPYCADFSSLHFGKLAYDAHVSYLTPHACHYVQAKCP